MTEKLLLTSLAQYRLVPTMHSHNWRKGNIILMSRLVVKRVSKYTKTQLEFNGYPNGFCGYAKAIVKNIDNPIGLSCYHCRKDILVGEMCLSKHRGRNTRAYYHLACAEQVNLI
jgi:hypothetical protein